jgi:hypothetical protein
MNLIIKDNDNINVPAVKKVEQFLPEIQKQTRAFDRSNSQTTLSMMSLTMLNGQSPMRMLRQIAAETEAKVLALNEAQFNLAKKEEKVKKLEAIESRTPTQEAELRMEMTNGETMMNKVNGALKDLAVLAEAYDNIKAKHGIDQWDETTFEAEEKKHHVRRGFELLYRNLIQYGRPQESTMEYLQQYGILVQFAINVTRQFIEQIDQNISEGKFLHANVLEDWLDHIAEQFKESPDLTTERIFGKKDITNKEFMLQIKGGKK